MRILYRWGVPSRIALGALMLAAVVAVHAALEANSLEPLPPLPRAEPFVTTPSARSPEGNISPVDDLRRIVLHSVARNPFRADRSRPPGRYGSLAGGSAAPESDSPDEAFPVPTPGVRVLGIAVEGGGRGLAAVEVQGFPPRLLRVGEEVGGLRLLSVSPGAIRLQGQDTVLVLRFTSSTP